MRIWRQPVGGDSSWIGRRPPQCRRQAMLVQAALFTRFVLLGDLQHAHFAVTLQWTIGSAVTVGWRPMRGYLPGQTSRILATRSPSRVVLRPSSLVLFPKG